MKILSRKKFEQMRAETLSLKFDVEVLTEKLADVSAARDYYRDVNESSFYIAKEAEEKYEAARLEAAMYYASRNYFIELSDERKAEIARLNREVAARVTEVEKLKAELYAAQADEALDSFDEADEFNCDCPACADAEIAEYDEDLAELLERIHVTITFSEVA